MINIILKTQLLVRMNNYIELHNKDAFIKMHNAGNLAAKVLDYITDYVKVGVSTGYLNDLCHDYIIKNNAIPAPLNYRGFPKSTCISVNHVVCHGIPGDKLLSDGDILNIDITVILDGWYGDTSRMFFVGKPSNKAKFLTKITYECLWLGIETVRPGKTTGDIGYAIQRHAESHGLSVVRDFTGHGLGKVFHCPPTILHYGKPNTGDVLEEGMIFTIEPMINSGKYDVKILSDGWTAVTRDKSLSAQFEHSIGVTSNGYEVFTNSPKGYNQPEYK